MASIGDYELKGDHVIAMTTGARIDLTPTLFRDIVRAMSFVGWVRAVRATRQARGKAVRARIAFFPLHPRTYYAIWPVCQLADVKIVHPDENPDLLFYFEDAEFRTEAVAPPATAPSADAAAAPAAPAQRNSGPVSGQCVRSGAGEGLDSGKGKGEPRVRGGERGRGERAVAA